MDNRLLLTGIFFGISYLVYKKMTEPKLFDISTSVATIASNSRDGLYQNDLLNNLISERDVA